MVDIAHGEKLKKIFRMVLSTGMKFAKRDMVMAGRDLQVNQNPVIRNLNTLLLMTASHLKQKDQWQSRTMTGYGQALLWMVVKDTAYRDPFFWMINEILKHPEEMKKLLEPYVKPPEEWIANQWEDSKNKTRLLKKKGDIPEHGKSFEETLFTPQIQDKRMKELKQKQKR